MFQVRDPTNNYYQIFITYQYVSKFVLPSNQSMALFWSLDIKSLVKIKYFTYLVQFAFQYDVTNVTSYLDAVLRTTKFATNYTLSRLRQPVNKTEWLRHASPAVVNAFYNGLENSIGVYIRLLINS